MKKYILALVAGLLAFPAAAAETLPSDIYDALIGLKKRTASSQLSEAEQALLAQYQNAVKGIIIVKVGFAGCGPCIALDGELQTSGMIDLWNARGFRFYELSSTEDSKRKKPTTFVSAFGVTSNPMMFFFKDGKLQTVLRGFNASQSAQIMQQIRNWSNAH